MLNPINNVKRNKVRETGEKEEAVGFESEEIKLDTKTNDTGVYLCSV